MEIGSKIIVIGCCGSGKSYFARQLHEVTRIPLFYLDCMFWKPGWVETELEEFIKKQQDVMKGDSWIIDGNYGATLELRFDAADTVFFLDMPEELCIQSESLRRGTKRDDLPSYLEEKYDPEFINFIKGFKDKGRPRILSLIEKYKDKQIIIFKSREEKEEYLKTLRKSI